MNFSFQRIIFQMDVPQKQEAFSLGSIFCPPVSVGISVLSHIE